VSPRRFNGWEPTETHTFLNQAGDPCPMGDAWKVVVTREPEWNERTRNLALGLSLHDRQTCPGCGLHESIRNDPENLFQLEVEHCPVCRRRDTYLRTLAEQDEKADQPGKPRRPADIPRPADGRHILLRPISRQEAEQNKQRRAQRRRDA